MSKYDHDFFAGDWREKRLGAFDIETTGLSAEKDRVTEVAFIIFEGGKPVERWNKLIHPGKVKYSPKAMKVSGITWEKLEGKKTFAERAKKIRKLIKSCDVLIGQNSSFDRSFLLAELERNGHPLKTWPPTIDTLTWARFFWPSLQKYNLDVIISRLNVSPDKKLLKSLNIKVKRHRADYDALVTGLALMKMASGMPKKLGQTLWVQDYLFRYWLATVKGGNKRFDRRLPHTVPSDYH